MDKILDTIGRDSPLFNDVERVRTLKNQFQDAFKGMLSSRHMRYVYDTNMIIFVLIRR